MVKKMELSGALTDYTRVSRESESAGSSSFNHDNS